MRLRDYLQAFDRHKSIDNCFLVPANGVDTCESVYYDDIKKLTNHLFKITTNHYSDTQPKPHPPSSLEDTHKTSHDDDDDKIVVDVNNNKIDDETSLIDGGKQQHQHANENDDAARNCNQFSEIFKKFTKLADSGSIVSAVPWATTTKRTKFRINQTSSRDVPIVKTNKPAKLTKQNAIDDATVDTKLFDETVNHISSSAVRDAIVSLLDEKFANKSHRHMFRHETFVSRLPNGSISFDCGQLGVEQRSMNTIRALFQLHASTGTSVRQMQAQIESKNK